MVLAMMTISNLDTKESEMKEAKIVELVLWKPIDGVTLEAAQKAVVQLNDFVQIQPGFVSRKTALSEDGQFIDLVYWEDIQSAKIASGKAMKNENLIPIFSTMKQEEMIFQHFEIFNEILSDREKRE